MFVDRYSLATQRFKIKINDGVIIVIAVLNQGFSRDSVPFHTLEYSLRPRTFTHQLLWLFWNPCPQAGNFRVDGHSEADVQRLQGRMAGWYEARAGRRTLKSSTQINAIPNTILVRLRAGSLNVWRFRSGHHVRLAPLRGACPNKRCCSSGICI